jgi:hypothetical protein
VLVAAKRRYRAAETGERRPARSELSMWIRGIPGVVLCLVGAVWIAQGTGALHGSMMTGKGRYAVLGVVVALIGLALLASAWRVRRGRSSSS